MEVILLEKIRNLGNLGDQVRVKAGYARNFLVPQGKAAPATAENVAAFEARRAELEQQQQSALATAESRSGSLEGLEVTIPARVGEGGRLFGSVGTRELAEAISAMGTEVARNEVHLPQGSLRQAGDYEVEVALHSDVTVTVKVSIVPES